MATVLNDQGQHAITQAVLALLAGADGSGVASPSNPIPISPVSGGAVISPTNPMPVVGQAYSASATFTPAASTHTAPACNGAAAAIAFGAISGSRVMITSAALEIDGATAEATAWRLYLYSVTPPSALTDTTTFDVPAGDRASYLGYVDLGTAVDLGSTQWVETNIINKQVKLAGTGLFGYLVNLTTLTPAAVAHIVTLHAVGL